MLCLAVDEILASETPFGCRGVCRETDDGGRVLWVRSEAMYDVKSATYVEDMLACLARVSRELLLGGYPIHANAAGASHCVAPASDASVQC